MEPQTIRDLTSSTATTNSRNRTCGACRTTNSHPRSQGSSYIRDSKCCSPRLRGTPSCTLYYETRTRLTCASNKATTAHDSAIPISPPPFASGLGTGNGRVRDMSSSSSKCVHDAFIYMLFFNFLHNFLIF